MLALMMLLLLLLLPPLLACTRPHPGACWCSFARLWDRSI